MAARGRRFQRCVHAFAGAIRYAGGRRAAAVGRRRCLRLSESLLPSLIRREGAWWSKASPTLISTG